MRKLWIALSLLLLAMTTPVFAEDIEPSKEEKIPSTYAPDFCEFTVTFPDEPYKTRRCDNDDPDKCYDQISYTQVNALSSTVNFRVICNPIGEDVIKNYSGEVMEATLKAMTKDTVVKTFDTSFREEKNYKQAGLVGEGKTGRLPTVFIAQLWIGKKSALSVEAELIGEPDEATDKAFSDVLKSISHKDEAPKAEEKKEDAAKEEAPKDSSPEKKEP